MHFIGHIQLILLLLMGIQPGSWKFEFEKEGVKVYTQSIEGSSFKAFKGEMIMNGSSDEISRVLMDIENYKDWSYRTTSTKILKKENNTIYYHYISETPIMVKDREGYFCSTYSKDAVKNEITVKMTIYESKVEVPSGFVRIPYSDGFWKLTPLGTDKTKVVFQMHAEPGGLIPAWLSNLISSEAPWITMTNLQKVVLGRRKK